MKPFINGLKQSCDGSEINLAKLAVIAALITLLGDFIGFVAALLALQQVNSENNSKQEIKQRIDQIYQELDKISESL